MTIGKVVLIDTPGLVCRSYYALPPMNTASGLPTNAAYGFTKTIVSFLRDERPTHVGMCFDLHGRIGRQFMYPEYKSNRDSAPSDLAIQFDMVKSICVHLGLTIVESDCWEADDVAGSMAKKAVAAGYEVEIVTSDKDFQQLLEPGVTLWDPAKRIKTTHLDIPGKYEVNASQMVDYQTLIGDSIDNVPNVKGIGPKTAAKLLSQFGTIDSMLTRLDEIKQDKVRQCILNAGEDAIRMVRDLVRFRTDLLPDMTVEHLARKRIDIKSITSYFDELEFSRRMLPAVMELNEQ